MPVVGRTARGPAAESRERDVTDFNVTAEAQKET